MAKFIWGENGTYPICYENEVAQSCLTLCDPIDCSLPGSSVHEISQARILEWVVISFKDILFFVLECEHTRVGKRILFLCVKEMCEVCNIICERTPF